MNWKRLALASFAALSLCFLVAQATIVETGQTPVHDHSTDQEGGPISGAAIHPFDDSISVVNDPTDTTKQMRIDVGLVATGTVRVLNMADQNIDLTPGTGSFSSATGTVLLAGRAGGQTINGGTAASENMTLISTSNVTKGSIIVSDDIDLGDSIADTISFIGTVDTSILFDNAARQVGMRSAAVDTNSSALTLEAGFGGNASATGGGQGGTSKVMGGNGGNGTASLTAGQGGDAILIAGTAGVDNGGGGGIGGDVIINAGTGTGVFVDGAIRIGNTAATDIFLGASTTAQAGITVPDSQFLNIGTGLDLRIVHDTVNTVMTSATGNLTIDNTNTTGATQLQLGTDTAATDFQVLNNTGTTIFEVDGNGDSTIAGKLTVGGVIDPTQLLLTGSDKKLGATDAGSVYLAPFSNSTTAVQVREADDTEVVFNVDTLNGRVGIENATGSGPLYRLDVGANSYFAINGNFAHIIQHNSAATTFWSIAPRNGGDFDIAVTTSDPRPSSGTIGASDNAISIKANKDVGFLGNVDIAVALKTNNLQDYGQIAAPAVSATNEARIYFDSTAKKLRVSENAGAFVDLLSVVKGTIDVGDVGGTPTGSLTVTGDLTSATKTNAGAASTIAVVYPNMGNPPIVSMMLESTSAAKDASNDLEEPIILNITSTGLDIYLFETGSTGQDLKAHLILHDAD